MWDEWISTERDAESEMDNIFFTRWINRGRALRTRPAFMSQLTSIASSVVGGWVEFGVLDETKYERQLWIPPYASRLTVAWVVVGNVSFDYNPTFDYSLRTRMTLGGVVSPSWRIHIPNPPTPILGPYRCRMEIEIPDSIQGTVQTYFTEGIAGYTAGTPRYTMHLGNVSGSSPCGMCTAMWSMEESWPII